VSDAQTAHSWDQYTLLQPSADRRKLDHWAWSADERLEKLLDQILAGTQPADDTVRQTQADNLLANRAGKHRRRRKLFDRHVTPNRPLWNDLDPADVAGQTDAVEWVRHQTTVAEWQILWGLASDQSYGELSDQLDATVGTLKSLASRCRSRLRAA
jgi:hypothetical protein